MLKASVVGASGYSGGEIVRLLSCHPGVELEILTASTQAGRQMAEAFAHLRGFSDHTLEVPDWRRLGEVSDVVFLALPHGLSMNVVPGLLDAGTKVVDVGADFRLRDPELYRQWYDLEHSAPQLLAEAVYGLPELNREAIAAARLVACPGCYPTAACLALLPLLQSLPQSSSEVIGPLIVDAKSGVSGAGRNPTAGTHFAEVNENVRPYKLGAHRHMPEMAQTFEALGCHAPVFFSPHLIPITRGILATCYACVTSPPSQAAAQEIWENTYRQSPFVRVLAESLPETKATLGSNFCDVAVRVDEEKNLVVAVAALDNLVKGAAGQAIQCMNLMFDLPEEEGLWLPPVVP